MLGVTTLANILGESEDGKIRKSEIRKSKIRKSAGEH